MYKYILITLILMTSMLFVYGVNHMDVIQTLSGEFAGSEFGITMTSMDFNGDGFEDLIVSSSGWNTYGVYADSSRYGKLYFYWGGPDFDNIPDFIIQGTYNGDLETLRTDLCNVGDVNNDGIDDLAISSKTEEYDLKVALYFGRPNPQSFPDIVLNYSNSTIDYVNIYPLGDINGDEHDDISLTLYRDGRYINTMLIWTDITAQPWIYRQTSNQYAAFLMNGIGDVNCDGIDDCYMQFPIEGMDQTNRKLVIYYGNSNFPDADSLVICENTNQVTTDWGCPVGDVNNDGIDDFIAFNNHIWQGNNPLSSIWNVMLTSQYGFWEIGSGFPFVFGDFNNDGIDDILSSNHIYGWNSGVANIWLGSNQMNGTQDLVIFPPENYQDRNFGWAKATGDFNGDGFCDIAVSAPWWNENDHNQTGKVFVYAGNAQLADTTVGIEDDTAQAFNDTKWEVIISPNPVKKHSSQVKINFTGTGYKQVSKVKIAVYDVKGQKILSQSVPDYKLKEGNWSLALKGIKPGLYIISVFNNSNKLVSSKFTIN